MNKVLTIPVRLASDKVASRVWKTACIHIRSWSSAGDSKNVINITRIYNDKDGNSHFGTMEVELKGSGECHK